MELSGVTVLGTRQSCRVLFMTDLLSSIRGPSVHFAKFPLLRFSKATAPPNFDPISTKLYVVKYGNRVGVGGGVRVLPNFNNIRLSDVSHFNYIVISRSKPMLIWSGKRSSRVPRPLGRMYSIWRLSQWLHTLYWFMQISPPYSPRCAPVLLSSRMRT